MEKDAAPTKSDPGAGFVVTIDGPAGSGKSSTAREVARRLGFHHLDSGALYRALTFALLREGTPPEEWPGMSLANLRRIPLDIRPGHESFQVLHGERVLTDELRTDEVTAEVSRAAGTSAVRARLLDLQRRAARVGALVADGRDMGTVVFPAADVKIFLTAELPERARRRLLERQGDEPSREQVEDESRRIEERDRLDSEREVSPLRCPDGATVVDTTHRSFDEQVSSIVSRVEAALRARDESGS